MVLRISLPSSSMGSSDAAAALEIAAPVAGVEGGAAVP
jgi:hypothetical protein